MNIKVVKREGKVVEFNPQNIYKCFNKAFWDAGDYTEEVSQGLADCFIEELSAELIKEQLLEKESAEQLEEEYTESEDITLTIDEMQVRIENFLMKNGYYDVAREYIIYEQQKNVERNYVKTQAAFIDKYRKSNNNANATIDDNSNVNTHNIATLNAEIHKPDNIKTSRGMIMDRLRMLYPDFDAKQYVRDLESHIIYKHDESSFAGPIAPYCCAISMYPFLLSGIEKLGGHSAKPENLDSFCGIYTNLVHAISGQFAGAVATPEFLMYFDYFCRKRWGEKYAEHLDDPDGYFCQYDEKSDVTEDVTVDVTEEDYPLSWKERFKSLFTGKIHIRVEKPVANTVPGKSISIRKKIYQKFQQVVYTINQPAGCRGNQSAFVNFSYFDEGFFHSMFDEFVFPDGSKPSWESLKVLQQVFIKWFNAERERTILTFPVESFALIYKDGKFEDEENAKFVAKMYSEGHSFFTYLSSTADSLSSCCFDGEEKISVNINNKEEYISISDFVNKYTKDLNKDGIELDTNSSITSFNLNGEKEPTNITGILKKEYTGNMYEFEVDDKKINVTADHLLMIKNKITGEVQEIAAEYVFKNKDNYLIAIE